MSTSVSSVISHFPDAENGFTTTTSGSVTSGAATVGLNSVAGYTNGQPAVFVIDPLNAKKQTFTGIVDTSGVQVTSVVWTAGSNVAHDAGATVVDYATATHVAMISKGILVQHNQDGTHKAITSTNATLTTPTITSPTTQGLVDGWVGANESWTYASATTITVPTDATVRYDVGDYIKITQSATVKYFRVTVVAATLLTVDGIAGVTVANSAISANAYSKANNPHGAVTAGPYQESFVSTGETHTSGTYGGLSTAHSVTVTVGLSGRALFGYSARQKNDTNAAFSFIAPVVSGATTVAVSDDNALLFQQPSANIEIKHGITIPFTGLTPGVNTFTMQNKEVTGGSGAGTSTTSRRHLWVLPL